MNGRSTVGIWEVRVSFSHLVRTTTLDQRRPCYIYENNTGIRSPTNILLEVELTRETNPVRRMLVDLCERAEEPSDRR